ncbi:hypothetical protein GF327_07205 [Candidatus Woesearchaeota archaeon]|nr:hypothetical protein [Candidatus Woesearchaeota archaeon]
MEKINDSVKQRIRSITNNKRILIIILIFLFLVLYVGTHFKRIFFISVLTVIGSLSLIYVRFIKEAYVLGVELVMFATILCGYAYGPVVGGIVGFITIFVSQIYSGRFKLSTFISIVFVPVIGIAASFFYFYPINRVGIILVLIYDIFILPLYYITGSRISSVIIYFATHILFNIWLFDSIAPGVLKIMGV